MDKLTKHEQDGIAELMHHIHNKEVVQCILETLGKDNWTRDILGNSFLYLTEEQEDILGSLGGLYSSEEIDEILDNDDINYEIAEKLKEQGVTHYLYENEDYLDEIREGKIICEGIDVDEIKNMLFCQSDNYDKIVDDITQKLEKLTEFKDSIFPKGFEYNSENYKMYVDKENHLVAFYKIVHPKKGEDFLNVCRCFHSVELKKMLETQGIKPLDDADPSLLKDLETIFKEDDGIYESNNIKTVFNC